MSLLAIVGDGGDEVIIKDRSSSRKMGTGREQLDASGDDVMTFHQLAKVDLKLDVDVAFL
jgi:hypothetical protein